MTHDNRVSPLMPLIILLLLCFPFEAVKADDQMPNIASIMIGGERINVDKQTDFDVAHTLQLTLAIPVYASISTVIALHTMRETEDTGADDVSDYAVYINSTDLTAGLRFTYQTVLADYYLQAGLSYSKIDMRVEEYYFSQRPELSDEESDKVGGGFIALGAYIPITQHWQFQSELAWQRRKDVFSNSSKAFDIDSYGLSVGMAYAF